MMALGFLGKRRSLVAYRTQRIFYTRFQTITWFVLVEIGKPSEPPLDAVYVDEWQREHEHFLKYR